MKIDSEALCKAICPWCNGLDAQYGTKITLKETKRIEENGYVSNLGEVKMGDWIHLVDFGYVSCQASLVREYAHRIQFIGELTKDDKPAIDFEKIKSYAHTFFNITEKIGNSYYCLKREVGEREHLKKIFSLLLNVEEKFDDVLVEIGLKYRK